MFFSRILLDKLYCGIVSKILSNTKISKDILQYLPKALASRVAWLYFLCRSLFLCIGTGIIVVTSLNKFGFLLYIHFA